MIVKNGRLLTVACMSWAALGVQGHSPVGADIMCADYNLTKHVPGDIKLTDRDKIRSSPYCNSVHAATTQIWLTPLAKTSLMADLKRRTTSKSSFRFWTFMLFALSKLAMSLRQPGPEKP